MTKTTWMAAALAALASSDLAMAQRCPGRCGGEPRSACVLPQRIEQQAAQQPMDITTMLQRTLANEYFARDLYRAANERFADRRFANLARAEQHHIDAVTAILTAAGTEPVTTSGREIRLPDTLRAAEEAAADQERTMIADYDALLARVDDAAVRPTLERIQLANRRHLDATSRGAQGPGARRGKGPNGPRWNQDNGRGPGRGNAVDSPTRCAAGSRSCRR